jgi:CHAT domain-containing protein/tetratricopeptide (TPR) repeat protein
MLALWSSYAIPVHAAPPNQEDNAKVQAYALLQAGVDLYQQGDFQGGLKKLEEALVLLQGIDDPPGEAAALGNIGAIYAAMGQQERALPYLKHALALTRQVADRRGEAFALNNIGAIYFFLSDYPNALSYFQQALAVHREIGNQVEEATVLVNLGAIYQEQGYLQQALTYFQGALPLHRQTGDRLAEAGTLGHIGFVYQNLGRLQQAQDYIQQALDIYRQIGARHGEAQALSNLASINLDLDQSEQARDQFAQAMAIFREAGDRWAEASMLDNLGMTDSRLGQPQQAITHFESTLPIRQAIGDRAGEAQTLNNLGTVYRGALDQPRLALKYFQQALSLARSIGDRRGEATILENIGLAYLDLDQQPEAVTHLRHAIDIVEAIRGEMSIEELKSGFAARNADPYQIIIPLLLEMGHADEAFVYAERARARAFLDQLGNIRINSRQGADPTLIEAEQRLVGEITDLDRYLRTLTTKPVDHQTQTRVNDLQTQLTAKRAEYADLLIQLKLSNPVYASLVSIEPMTLAQIQSEVLSENSALVSYFVTDKQTIAFIISRHNFDAVAIDVSRQELVERITAFRSLLALEAEGRVDRVTRDRIAAAQALDAVLLMPLQSHLPAASTDASHPSLIIAPHDILHYLPFAALLDEAESPLATRFTLSLIPSASTLSYAQANQSPDNGRLLALGNPSAAGLSALPYADREVEALTKLYRSPTIFTGSTATETAFRNHIAEVDWIHLAVHGQLNSASPLFSVLYLADESSNNTSANAARGSPVISHDGRLEVHEIFNLDLTGVNGVVLSACETGLGELNRGDELVGLTRALLYAGSPVVVATLWPVEDEATAVLMTAFHQYLRRGLGPAAALRAAQSEIQQNPAWVAPYYWAGFQVIGDGGPVAKPVDQDETVAPASAPAKNISLTQIVAGIAGLLVLLGLAGWVVWRRGWLSP